MSVVVIVTNEAEAPTLIRWAWHFATARSSDVVVLRPEDARTPMPTITYDHSSTALDDPVLRVAVETLRELDRSRTTAVEVTSEQECRPAFRPAILKVQQPYLYPTIVEELTQRRAQLLVIGKHKRLRGEQAEYTLVRQLFHRAFCDTLLIRPGASCGSRCSHILVPVARGPHAKAALGWSAQLAMENNGLMTALYVEADHGPEAEAVGRHQIESILSRAGVATTSWVSAKVVVADNIPRAIADNVSTEHDLVLVGASDRGLMRRILFGTLPAQVISGDDAVAVAVMRSARPLATRLRDMVEEWLDLRVPQMDRGARVDLVENLETGSRWNFDFMVLMCLATCIAAFGLIQSSTAVVIGAMLVAPLMTPLIASGLALAQGNIPLIRDAIRSLLYGFLLALGIGLVCGLLSPMRELTPELTARGSPSLFDLAVAFVSGIAAAYAMARPNLSASLPGVAIAAALVPPLATVGIALAFGELIVARGAAMLFTTNVVAIVLGAAGVFYACGVRGNRQTGQQRVWVRRTIFFLVLSAIIIAIPLTSVLVANLTPSKPAHLFVSDAIRATVATELARSTEIGRIVSIRAIGAGQQPVIEVTIQAPAPPDKHTLQLLADAVGRHFKTPIRVRVITNLIGEAVTGEK